MIGLRFAHVERRTGYVPMLAECVIRQFLNNEKAGAQDGCPAVFYNVSAAPVKTYYLELMPASDGGMG